MLSQERLGCDDGDVESGVGCDCGGGGNGDADGGGDVNCDADGERWCPRSSSVVVQGRPMPSSPKDFRRPRTARGNARNGRGLDGGHRHC